MATYYFEPLRFKAEDIKKLLKDSNTKDFKRLCLQFYRRKDDTFTLVAQVLGNRRKRISTKLIFIDAVTTKSVDKLTLGTEEFIFLQHEISRKQIKNWSKEGKEDLIFTPKTITVNPDAVTYDVNGQDANPCPPADPPTN
jgi:hypothetical protein